MPINHQQIRVLAVALIEHQGKFLAHAGFDRIKQQRHLRLLGGGIEFGENSLDALRREIKEELGLLIINPKLLAVEEDIFIFNGLPAHEIMFLYKVDLKSKKAYQQLSFPILDSKHGHRAEWYRLSELKGRKLYPLLARKYL